MILLAGVFVPLSTFTCGAAGWADNVAEIWGNPFKRPQLVSSLCSANPLGVPVEWSRAYGGSGWDVANSVQQTSDGGYVIAGSTCSFGAGKSDCWLIKIDAYGNVEWNQTYGGPDEDDACSVQQTSDGGYIIAGATFSVTDHLYGAMFLAKTDGYGNLEWNRTYGGASWEIGRSVQQTSDGGYVVCGLTASFGAGSGDYWLIKTDSHGNMEWNKTYGGTEWDEAYSVQQTSDGGYIMVGSANSFKTGIFDGEIWLIKTGAYGNTEWTWLSGWPDSDSANSVEQTSDGGYIVAGTRFSSYATRADFWLIKINENGTLNWDKVYAGPSDNTDFAHSIQQTSDGGYIIAGGTYSYTSREIKYWLVKSDSCGNAEWNRTYGGPDSSAYSVQQTSDGGYIVAGEDRTPENGYGDVWVIKFFADHDVAVSAVEPSKTVIGQGYSTPVNVTANDPGFFTEAFNVTLYANTTAIETQTVSNLGPEASTNLTFTWNTSGLAQGNYVLSACATTVTDETNTADNTFIGNVIAVTIPGDVDGDFHVFLWDAVKLLARYSVKRGEPNYDSNCDIDGDDQIFLYDAVILLAHYGQQNP